MNFVMDAEGGLYLSDPRVEVEARTRKDEKGRGVSARSNHSSLVAGADAAGAGQMRLREGRVGVLHDGSGHYQPGTAQTWQVARELQAKGAMDPERSSVELVDKGVGPREDLLVSGLEFDAYAPEMQEALERYRATGDKGLLDEAERKIREAHAKKTAVLSELTRKVPRKC